MHTKLCTFPHNFEKMAPKSPAKAVSRKDFSKNVRFSGSRRGPQRAFIEMTKGGIGFICMHANGKEGYWKHMQKKLEDGDDQSLLSMIIYGIRSQRIAQNNHKVAIGRDGFWKQQAIVLAPPDQDTPQWREDKLNGVIEVSNNVH